MYLITCKLCGRLFSAARGKICITCLDEVDSMYPKVREYLRDHSQESFNLERIAEDMNFDIRYVQALVELGYLDRALPGEAPDEEEKKRKQLLLNELQASLNSSPMGRGDKTAGKMYGQQRYGTDRKSNS